MKFKIIGICLIIVFSGLVVPSQAISLKLDGLEFHGFDGNWDDFIGLPVKVSQVWFIMYLVSNIEVNATFVFELRYQNVTTFLWQTLSILNISTYIEISSTMTFGRYYIDVSTFPSGKFMLLVNIYDADTGDHILYGEEEPFLLEINGPPFTYQISNFTSILLDVNDDRKLDTYHCEFDFDLIETSLSSFDLTYLVLIEKYNLKYHFYENFDYISEDIRQKHFVIDYTFTDNGIYQFVIEFWVGVETYHLGTEYLGEIYLRNEEKTDLPCSGEIVDFDFDGKADRYIAYVDFLKKPDDFIVSAELAVYERMADNNYSFIANVKKETSDPSFELIYDSTHTAEYKFILKITFPNSVVRIMGAYLQLFKPSNPSRGLMISNVTGNWKDVSNELPLKIDILEYHVHLNSIVSVNVSLVNKLLYYDEISNNWLVIEENRSTFLTHTGNFSIGKFAYNLQNYSSGTYQIQSKAYDTKSTLLLDSFLTDPLIIDISGPPYKISICNLSSILVDSSGDLKLDSYYSEFSLDITNMDLTDHEIELVINTFKEDLGKKVPYASIRHQYTGDLVQFTQAFSNPGIYTINASLIIDSELWELKIPKIEEIILLDHRTGDFPVLGSIDNTDEDQFNDTVKFYVRYLSIPYGFNPEISLLIHQSLSNDTKHIETILISNQIDGVLIYSASQNASYYFTLKVKFPQSIVRIGSYIIHLHGVMLDTEGSETRWALFPHYPYIYFLILVVAIKKTRKR